MLLAMTIVVFEVVVGTVCAVKPLLMALKDSNDNVRRAAAAALGQIGDARALEPVLAALRDSDSEYGLPAVVNVRDATRLIFEGQAIVVDGNRSRVTLK
jgi:HEAT repeat protein